MAQNHGENRAERAVAVGHKTAQVADYVSMHPGCPKLHPADYVAPHGRGRQYGYNTVARALKAGLIENKSTGFSAKLYRTDKEYTIK